MPTDTELDEVKVNVARVPIAPVEDIPVIEVTARPVPWFVWASLGAILATVLFSKK